MTCWEGQEGGPQKPARRLKPVSEAKQVSQPRDGKHDQSHPDHDAEREEWNDNGGPVLWRTRFKADLGRGPASGCDKAAKMRDFK